MSDLPQDLFISEAGELSPKEQLIYEIDTLRQEQFRLEQVNLEQLKSLYPNTDPAELRPTAGFSVEEINPELIDSLNECEVAMFLAGIRTIIPATNIYNAYARETNYTDWDTFWKSQEHEVLTIVDGLWDALSYIPLDGKYNSHRRFLEQQIADFLAGRGRRESLAEGTWYDLPHDICRIDLRLSPQIEQDGEAYIFPERKGGNPTSTIRLVLGHLAPDQKSPQAKIVESSIAELLDAEELLSLYKTGYREDFVLVRGAMHGVSRATAHQYKRKGADGSNRVQFISNVNMQLLNRQEFLKRINRFFAPEILEDMRANVLDDSMEFRYGHEVCELLLEHKYPTQGREGTELLATIGTMEAVRRQIAETGDISDKMYDKMMKSFVSGYFDLISREPYDPKLEPYIRGDVAAMKKLRSAGAVVSDKDNRVVAIDRKKFETVISQLTAELLEIIKTGNTSAYNVLFELPKAA